MYPKSYKVSLRLWRANCTVIYFSTGKKYFKQSIDVKDYTKTHHTILKWYYNLCAYDYDIKLGCGKFKR